MLAAERQHEVLREVRSHGAANVSELAERLGVSLSTVRRDLRELSDKGLLDRVHGGASLRYDAVEERRALRQSEHQREKGRIGRAAAALVPDGATVLISGGTTTEAMLEHLAGRDGLTVITNNIGVAYRLARYPGIPLIVLGGVLRHHELSLLGSDLAAIMNDYHVDIAFTGAYAVDAEVGLYGSDVREVHTDRQMLRAADRLVVLADGSKFRRRGPVKLLPVEAIGGVVTDRSAPPEHLERLRARGIEVVLA